MVEQVVLVDGQTRQGLLPLTYLKAVAELQVGILPQYASWQSALPGVPVGYVDGLGDAHNIVIRPGEGNAGVLVVDAGLLAAPELVVALQGLRPGERLVAAERSLAWCTTSSQLDEMYAPNGVQWRDVQCDGGSPVAYIQKPYDLFLQAGRAIDIDFARVTAGRTSAPLSSTVGVVGGARIFIEPGAQLEFCTLNAREGVIYIGADAQVQEGAHIRGPFALGEGSTIKMGAKVYGPTVIGPHCKVGGELSNVSMQGYSNKGHDGFVGNAAIGSWCNLGADTNCSNLKNNYDLVRVWDIAEGRFCNTGLQFCGLLMGDHSKSGINTMFNTGTVVGAFCNIFGGGFPRAWLPSFSWGGASGLKAHTPQQAIETARVVMRRRGLDLTPRLEEAIRHLYESTATERPF